MPAAGSGNFLAPFPVVEKYGDQPGWAHVAPAVSHLPQAFGNPAHSLEKIGG